MISKNELKQIKALQLKRFRDLEKQFTAEGRNNVEEGIKSSFRCTHIVLSDTYQKANPEIIISAKAKNIRYSVINESDFNKVAGSVTPQGILAVFDIPDNDPPDFKLLNGPIVYLDNISDPGNAGTIIRSCDWFGIKHVILSRNSADVFNPKTVRASAGSLFHINIYRDLDISRFFSLAKQAGYTIAATVLNGENIYNAALPSKTIFIFSNEASGITDGVSNLADKKITIPGKGKAESLNVASAAAVILALVTKN